MKTKLFLTAAVASLLASPASHAAPDAATGCAKVTVFLNGVVAASPGTNFALPYGLLVDVVSTNASGRAYAKLPQPVTVLVGSSAAVLSREGSHTLEDFHWGDRVAVSSRLCADKLVHGSTPVLRVARIAAQRRT